MTNVAGHYCLTWLRALLHNRFAGVGVRPESPPKGADDSYEGLLAAEESSAFFQLIPQHDVPSSRKRTWIGSLVPDCVTSWPPA